MNPLDRETLENLYLVQGLSDRAIGDALHVPPHHVYLARRALGIPSRPRGHNLTGERRPQIDYGVMRGKRHTTATREKISAAAQRQVNRLSGPFHPMFGRSGEDNPNYRHGRSPERQRLYSTYEWRVVIEFVYLRDAGRCRRCGCEIPHTHKGRHHHHIRPFADFPAERLNPDNIVLMCRACHEWVHSALNVSRQFLIGARES